MESAEKIEHRHAEAKVSPAVACIMNSAPVAFLVPARPTEGSPSPSPVARMAIPVRRGVRNVPATTEDSPDATKPVPCLDLLVFLSPGEDLATSADLARLAAGAGVRVQGFLGYAHDALEGREAGCWVGQ